jgi:UPF0716 protein FxsA
MTAVILFLLFTVVPAIELWLIIKVGTVLGSTETVLSLVISGMIGTYMAKRAGLSVLRQLMQEVSSGVPPADRLIEGVLVLAAGLLLVTPGYISDIVGMMLFVGPIRRWLAPRIKTMAWNWFLQRGLWVGNAKAGPAQAASQSSPETPPPPHFRHPIA